MKILNYFTRFEKILWSVSVILIITSYVCFDRNNYLTLMASVVGVTSLIFNSKGNPAGPALMIIFSIIYGIISFSFLYYGEMITYLGMTAPMSVFALISWLRNPYENKKSEVKINRLSGNEVIFMFVLSIFVTVIFFFILNYFNTANIIPSTISVTTSFLGVYLTFRRSPYFALAYAANDIVLIVLWIIASFTNISYVSVVVCFIVFLINDLYGFANWRKMGINQAING